MSLPRDMKRRDDDRAVVRALRDAREEEDAKAVADQCAKDADFLREVADLLRTIDQNNPPFDVVCEELYKMADKLEATELVARNMMGRVVELRPTDKPDTIERCFQCEGSPFTCNKCPGMML